MNSNTALDKFGFTLLYQKGHHYGFDIQEKGDFYLSKKTLSRLVESSIMTIQSTKENIDFVVINRYTYNLLTILAKIEEMMDKEQEIWLAIDGYAGAGKTTLANQLGLVLDAQVFHTDDFFTKPVVDLTKPFSSYGSNIDYNKINESVFKPVSLKQSVLYQPFEFKTHQHLNAVEIPHRNIHIIEGAFTLHPYMKQTYDLKVFYHKSLIKQYIDIYRRNGLKRLWKFMTKWIPNERKYVKDLGIIRQCNIIIHS